MSAPVIPVVLVTGLHGTARTAAVARLFLRHPGAVAVHHDLGDSAGGRVTRTVRFDDPFASVIEPGMP
ncbi:hypothetical protein ACIBH1_29700 [Nonomuraea sp. NPDC050663]|uniref:hypothetical protein n=1 Tax=Nonomuraea sp. NPDC050663 TaxID=3364370 RepID=UPI0037941418